MKQIGEVIEGRPLFHVVPSDSVRSVARKPKLTAQELT